MDSRKLKAGCAKLAEHLTRLPDCLPRSDFSGKCALESSIIRHNCIVALSLSDTGRCEADGRAIFQRKHMAVLEAIR
jgi:hypothetical protein